MCGTEAVVDCSIFIRCCFCQLVYSDSSCVLSIVNIYDDARMLNDDSGDEE